MTPDLSVQESKCSPLPKNLNPRRYQVEVFKVAMKRNIIAVLETGAGRTMIAVILIKHIAECIKSTGQKKLIIFLAPTVYLVNQLHLEKVWRIFEPLLSPIVTPDSLKLPSLRILIELCDYLGYLLKEECIKEGNMVHAELILHPKDTLLVGKGCEPKKAARGAAAHCLSEKLEERGIFYSDCISKSRKHDCKDLDVSSSIDKSAKIIIEDSSQSRSEEKPKFTETSDPAESSLGGSSSLTNDVSNKICSLSSTTPVSESINRNKGGPRTSLFESCKRPQWPMPPFKTEETKSRVLVEFGEGSNKRCGFNALYLRSVCTYPTMARLSVEEMNSLTRGVHLILLHLQCFLT